MSGRPRVLLTTLSVRTSAKGNAYLSGWLGKASVVGFAGEPDRFGNPTWDLFLVEPAPRDGETRAGAGRPRESPAPAARPAAPPGHGARPGGPERARRRESEATRRERAAGEVARAHGVRSDADLSDPVPF